MITLPEIVHLIDTPLAFSFLAGGIIISIMTGFPQFRKFRLFLNILQQKKSQESTANTLSPLHALYLAMSSSLGMGNILTPAIAIAIGGPGALFWLIIYALFGAATKFTEVVFAVKYKRYAKDKTIMGGPTGYLYQVHPWLANWYGIFSIFIFSAWSALQSKALAHTYEFYGISNYATGILLAGFVFIMLASGTKTIGKFAARTVPILFIIYIFSACFIIFYDLTTLKHAIYSIFSHACCPTAAIGGFVGSTALMGLRQGIFKAAFTTEAGVGTAAIAHSYSQTDQPMHQGILGMYAIFMNTFLCIISGLVALVTQVWTTGTVSNKLALQAFTTAIPHFGNYIITFTVTLCIIGATLGNSFNASRCFGFFTDNRGLTLYSLIACLCIFLGATVETTTLWDIADLLLPLIAIPNLIGLIILTKKHRTELKA